MEQVQSTVCLLKRVQSCGMPPPDLATLPKTSQLSKSLAFQNPRCQLIKSQTAWLLSKWRVYLQTPPWTLCLTLWIFGACQKRNKCWNTHVWCTHGDSVGAFYWCIARDEWLQQFQCWPCSSLLESIVVEWWWADPAQVNYKWCISEQKSKTQWNSVEDRHKLQYNTTAILDGSPLKTFQLSLWNRLWLNRSSSYAMKGNWTSQHKN